MVLSFHCPILFCSTVVVSPVILKRAPPAKCFASMSKINEFQMNQRRRSANYHPTLWDHSFVESLGTSYSYESHGSKLDKLKEEARRLLKSTKDSSTLLKLVDSVQRLGVGYHFEEEIREIMMNLVHCPNSGNLYITGLHFRLLREHGYPISSGVFDKFKDKDGRLMECFTNDVMGLLSLYEASHHGTEDEHDLEEANHLSVKHLKSLMGKMEIKVAEQVQQSLEFPLHWRMQRLEAPNFISQYLESSLLLELAKLDYNLVQSVHQEEAKELTKWWKDLGLKDRLPFSRDRLMENYLWAVGIIFEPQFSKCRKVLTKFICILSAIDDMYDIYGSLDELERFTDAVNRWDIKAMDGLPDYMKICYSAMFEFGNEIAHDVQRNHGLNVISYVKEEWAKLCRSYLMEARWFYSGYIPKLDEYLENAWTSVGGHAAMAHAYLMLGFPITKASLDSFKIFSDPIYWSSLIGRLSDDLGTSKVEIMRGDVAKSIECYMIKEGVTEEEAREHIKGLIRFYWKKLNEASNENSLPKSVITTMSLNMARTAQCVYQYGDGIGMSVGVTKDRLTRLIVDPIVMG